jgi:allophanate hydrolase subunit 1
MRIPVYYDKSFKTDLFKFVNTNRLKIENHKET